MISSLIVSGEEDDDDKLSEYLLDLIFFLGETMTDGSFTSPDVPGSGSREKLISYSRLTTWGWSFFDDFL